MRYFTTDRLACLCALPRTRLPHTKRDALRPHLDPLLGSQNPAKQCTIKNHEVYCASKILITRAMSAKTLKLGLFSQSSFPAPVSPELLACSPTLNLAATVNNANTLAIRRAQGELVSSSTDRVHNIQALCWRPDGLLPPPHSRPYHADPVRRHLLTSSRSILGCRMG